MKDKVKYILQMPVIEAEKNLDVDCDILGLRFEGKTTEIEAFKKLLFRIEKPLMIRIDNVEYFQEILSLVDRECIVGIADEINYKDIVPHIIKGNHKLIIRTPIDINLAKEMNILTSDMGLSLDKILIDSDIGGLGYGFEYGYSIMEKIKQETKDKYLNMPIVSFAAEETAKTKEAKDENLALYLEIASASAVIAGGADYVVLTCPEAIKTLRRLR